MRRAALWLSVLLLVLAACGGDDAATAPGGAGGDAGAAVSEGQADGGAEQGADGTATSDGASGTASDDAGAPTGAPATGDGVGGEVLTDGPPPDVSAFEPSDEAPGMVWQFVRAYGEASAGGATYQFIGMDPFYFQAGGDWPDPARVWASGCSVLDLGADGITAGVSFHHATDRFDNVSFSMQDLGDGTVVWGLDNVSVDEEWSATGPGAASISYFRWDGDPDSIEDPEESYRQAEQSEFWARLGFPDGSEHLYVLIDFEGDATENFDPTKKSRASSRVLCHFLERP